MRNEEFIEYGGVSHFKGNSSQKNLFVEFSYSYDLDIEVEEITKINGTSNIEYHRLLGNEVIFCVFKINTSIEFIKNLENFSLSLKEFESYSSSFFTLQKNYNKETFKVYIKNIKGKLLSKSKILIFYNLLVDFN